MFEIDNFSGEYSFLSNFYPCDIKDILGNIYPSTEHYYQAMKTLNTKQRLEIRLSKTPGKAKQLGSKAKLRSNWKDIKLFVMREALKQKFERMDLKSKLKSTDDAILIEGNHWHDNYWGSCDCEKCRNVIGGNRLGQLLMEIRNN